MLLDDYGIEELELGIRAYNILKRMGVDTIGDLSRVTVNDLNAWTERTGVAFGLNSAMQVAHAQAYIEECRTRS